MAVPSPVDRAIRSAEYRTSTEELARLAIEDAYRRGRQDQLAEGRPGGVLSFLAGAGSVSLIIALIRAVS